MADLNKDARTWEANAVFEIKTEISETLQGIEDFMKICEREKERAAEKKTLTQSMMPSLIAISATGRHEMGDGRGDDEVTGNGISSNI